MILLEEKDHTGVILGNGQLIEDTICFPPPMMFRLRKLCLSVVSVQIRMLSIDATKIESSARQEQ